jgi:hypothetical protein
MDAAKLSETKRRVSKALLDEPGVSGVGLRDHAIVIYLASDDAGLRSEAETKARAIAPRARFVFDVAGEFRKR